MRTPSLTGSVSSGRPGGSGGGRQNPQPGRSADPATAPGAAGGFSGQCSRFPALNCGTGDASAVWFLSGRQQQRGGVLQLPDDGVAERGADGPVDDAVVERERQVDHVRRPDVAGGVEDRPLDDLADAQDADLRMVDDRRRDQAADVADRRDGEGAAAQVVELRLAGAGLGAEPLDLAGDARRGPCWSASWITGTIRPPGVATAMPMW